jgi:hypothetical protein
MMKRQKFLTLIIILLGVIVMTGFYNLEELKYVRYAPKDDLVDLTFEYPQGWRVFERRGAYGSFIQVQVLESLPESSQGKERVCNIVLTIYPKSQVGFAPLTVQGLADDIQKKRLALKGSKLLSSISTTVNGLEATDQQFSYETYKVPLQANAQPIPIIERAVCFQKGDNFYTVRLEEIVDSFADYNKVLAKMLGSIEFSD